MNSLIREIRGVVVFESRESPSGRKALHGSLNLFEGAHNDNLIPFFQHEIGAGIRMKLLPSASHSQKRDTASLPWIDLAQRLVTLLAVRRRGEELIRIPAPISCWKKGMRLSLWAPSNGLRLP